MLTVDTYSLGEKQFVTNPWCVAFCLRATCFASRCWRTSKVWFVQCVR